MTQTITHATEAWRLLNGVFCVYKPSEMASHVLRSTLIGNICRDLNLMEPRPPMKHVAIEGDMTDRSSLTVTSVPNLADNPLVVGPRYQPQDFQLNLVNKLGPLTSGLCIVGINDGCKLATRIKYGQHLRAYRIEARLGITTNNLFIHHGKVVEKSTHEHVTQSHLDRELASVQAAQQKLMFQTMGVPLASQEAYEIAAKGPIRPTTDTAPVVYSIKCTEFNSPNFTLDIHTINETEDFLLTLVHDIGLSLRTNATCTRIRQIRYGHFGLDLALLRKHWTLEYILNNILACRQLTGHPRLMTPGSPTLGEGGPTIPASNAITSGEHPTRDHSLVTSGKKCR